MTKNVIIIMTKKITLFELNKLKGSSKNWFAQSATCDGSVMIKQVLSRRSP